MVEIQQSGVLTATVDDVSGDATDVDVHLLSAPSEDACVARGNVSASTAVEAGSTWWIAADTWVNSSGDVMSGPFVLSIDVIQPTPVTPSDCLSGAGGCLDGVVPEEAPLPAEAPGTGGCPAGMVRVDTFCVDRFEASLELDGARWSPYLNPGDSEVTARSVGGVVPQGYITQVQATAACDRAGKRLCTDAEWLRACRGPDDTVFPYGSALQPGVCNDDRECHPVVQTFGTGADWIWSKLANSCINQLPESLAMTGANVGCETADGLMDMMGNLHEWTADPAGTFRGGFYADTVINGPGCLYATTAHNTVHWDYSTGFRCCAQ